MIVNGNPLTDIQRAASANPKVLFEPEPNGRSLLYLSVWEGRVDVMEWLLSQGLDPNARQSTTFGGAGETSLQLAASLGNLSAVRILCQYGADPLKNDHNGFNSIEIANGMDAKEVALFLEEWVKQKKR